MSCPVIPEAASPALSGSDGRPVRFNFDNTYARLPQRFYSRLDPTPVAAPRLIKLNAELAQLLGLDPAALSSPEGVAVLAGNRIAEGAEPLAMAYAGHQFGHFVPQLGDGRANLLGEVIGHDALRYDIQLKGAGPTPYSRRGDGRAALGPVLREYLVSEAMAALGVPTTRALAAVATWEQVFRETVLPGAVLTRVAASHLRVGTFQYFAAQGDTEAIRTLADYTIGRHYPDAARASHPYRALLDGVIGRQANLIAQWMLLGFIHGVMNTDNMSIAGETIDYGPCAFMEAYDPDTVFSSIDLHGRYAYANQPNAAHWNLTRFAESLLSVLEHETGSEAAAVDSAQQALAAFGPQFESARLAGWRRKLGLITERGDDAALVDDLLQGMAASRADFTLTFRRLCDAVAQPTGDEGPTIPFASPAPADSAVFAAWVARWRRRLALEPLAKEIRAAAMRAANPAFIPRNHMVQAALEAAIERQDFKPFQQLLDVVSRPYSQSCEDRPDLKRYATPARPEEYIRHTFCGT